MTVEIIDLEYVADYGTVGTCRLCDEPIEHGQIRALVAAGDGQRWAHDYCAEPLNLGDPQNRDSGQKQRVRQTGQVT